MWLNQKKQRMIVEGLLEDPLLTISAICPNVMQGQQQVIKPWKKSAKEKKNNELMMGINRENVDEFWGAYNLQHHRSNGKDQ